MRSDRGGPRRSLLLGFGALTLSCVPEGPRTDGEASPSESARLLPGDRPTSRDVDPPLRSVFRDDFEREGLGANYRPLSNRWAVTEGQLCVRGARNRGVWLQKRLPKNVRIAFDARSDSDEGDLKVEVFGDGASGATHDRYDDATGYVLIFGGWHNSLHVLARGDEHGANRLESKVRSGPPGDDTPLAQQPVKAHRAYRFRIERTGGNTLRWWVDGQLLFERIDEDPLTGLGHDHFAFNNWNAPVCFDNLEISPL